MPPKDPGALAFAHPLFATAVLVLCFIELRAGLRQRTFRTRKVAPPPGNLKRHTRLGPWAVGLFAAAAVGGLGSSVALRDWAPLGTWHGRVGLAATLLYALVWLLGRKLLGGAKQHANLHGVLATLGLFLGGICALLGLDLLP